MIEFYKENYQNSLNLFHRSLNLRIENNRPLKIIESYQNIIEYHHELKQDDSASYYMNTLIKYVNQNHLIKTIKEIYDMKISIDNNKDSTIKYQTLIIENQAMLKKGIIDEIIN